MYAALGIVLIVAGAILTFAIDRQADGVDIDAIGWILMAAGALSLLVALFQAAAWTSWRKRHYVTERHVSPDGDIHATAAYRRRVAATLAERTLTAALDRCGGAQ